jgi:hypothetical protein
MRAAGTVIWATDLVEHRSTSGGKGRPKVTTYSYSASFAVALSGRRVASIGRIWADGKLLRGGAGDFKSTTLFRLHDGDEDQAPDPLIVAAEAAGQAPAYRGTAYAVFEDMNLEDFGNRIPSLTFEIVAEAAPVPIGAIAEALADRAVTAGETPALSGYAATGDSVRGALEGLADIVPLSLADDGVRLCLRAGAEAPTTLPAALMTERPQIVRRGQGAVPGEVSIAYYEAARDYQTGLQRAVRSGGRGADRRTLPAVIDACGAKALADYRLASLWAGRTSSKAVLAWRSAAIRPGDHVAIEGEAGLWKIGRWTLGALTVTQELVRVPAAPPPVVAASPGRAVREADLPHGPTLVRLFELPLGDGLETKPILYAAAAGESPGWRRAALSVSFDGGASWQDVGSTAPSAVMGLALEVLAPAGSAMFDTNSSLEVELLNDAMWLEGRSDDALVGGANLAAVGGELIQFGAVEALGERRFRLSRLLRGRRGTEWAAGSHEAGEPFTLIARETLTAIEAPAGIEVQLLASGVGDIPDAASASRIVEAEVLRPPSPVHLTAVEALGGRRFRLSRLLRGRRGTEWAAGSHEAGEAFTLITRDTLTAIEAPVGVEVQLLASGVGDVPDAASASRVVEAEVLRPPSPVHLTAVEAPDGSLVISWIRRSRQGWGWTDGVETPLGEETERYRLTLAGPDFERAVETSVPGYIYTSVERAADGPGPLVVEVTQTGKLAASRAAHLIVD